MTECLEQVELAPHSEASFSQHNNAIDSCMRRIQTRNETVATPYPVQRSELIGRERRLLLPSTDGTARRHSVALRSTAHNQTKQSTAKANTVSSTSTAAEES
jgi:hypothetical protein